MDTLETHFIIKGFRIVITNLFKSGDPEARGRIVDRVSIDLEMKRQTKETKAPFMQAPKQTERIDKKRVE